MSTNLLEPKKSKRKRISLMMDWVFKYVFYVLEDPSIFVSFLMAVDPSFKKIRLFPNEERIEHPDSKAIRYDIRGIINEEIYFDLEIQQEGNLEDQEIRIVFYLSRLLSSQATKGKDYRELKPVRVIMITNFSLLKGKKEEEISDELFYLVGEKTGMSLTKHIQVSIIEVGTAGRLLRKPLDRLSALDHWRIVFKFAGDPEKEKWIEQIMSMNEGCRKAVKKMQEIPMDMIEYMNETDRLDRAMVRNGEIRRARERAMEQGLAQGALLKLIRQTLKKLEKGLTIAEIAEDLMEEEGYIQRISEIKHKYPDYSDQEIAVEILTGHNTVRER
ncbi:Rpn family recombination-promoting nuclease/putative transposase [Holdemania massiliensis]|uniref:Rpn family recombination-promoting nuclease/putative transposase n=1 Tax=Holdemania massiliensis TaxID=1468449 RepID=UPI003522A9B1